MIIYFTVFYFLILIDIFVIALENRQLKRKEELKKKLKEKFILKDKIDDCDPIIFL